MRNWTLSLSVGIALWACQSTAMDWPNQSARLERELRHQDASVRVQAAQNLRHLSNPAARSLCLLMLSDTDIAVRLIGAELSTRFRVKEAARVVTPWLAEGDVRLRRAALAVLRAAPSSEAVLGLGRVLNDPSAELRTHAAHALGTTGEASAAMALLGHLDDTKPQVRIAIIHALAELGEARAVMPLVSKVRDVRAGVREAAIFALASFADARALSSLTVALGDSEVAVRRAAATSLGWLRARTSVPDLIQLAESDPESSVVGSALIALGRVGDAAALGALLRGLERRAVAPAAIAGLERFAEPKLRDDALRRCVKLSANLIRIEGCARALVRVKAKGAGERVVGALRGRRIQEAVGLGILGNIGEAEFLPTVLEYLSAGDPLVRSRAIAAASKLLDPERPDGRVIEPIVHALRGARHRVREQQALLRLLGQSGAGAAIELLAEAAEGEESLKLAAVSGLGNIRGGGKSGELRDTALLRTLQTGAPVVRLQAARGIARVSGESAGRSLVQMFGEALPAERAWILRALRGVISRHPSPQLLASAQALMSRAVLSEQSLVVEIIAAGGTQQSSDMLTGWLADARHRRLRGKIAEGLAAQPSGAKALATLVQHPDVAVRSNASWSLGHVGSAEHAASLRLALLDPEVSVVANAVSALGTLSARHKLDATKSLCQMLDHDHPYVVSNALGHLLGATAACGEGTVRRLVVEHPSGIVRQSAARWLVASPELSPADKRALRWCASRDPVGKVALVCSGSAAIQLQERTHMMSILVVPSGSTHAMPRGEYCVEWSNGQRRLGLADLRGGLFEAHAPSGDVGLCSPASEVPFAGY